MAIIYTYPSATPKASDKLIGTVTEDVNAVNVVKGNPTRSFTLSAVQSLFNQDVVNVVVPITATVFKTKQSIEGAHIMQQNAPLIINANGGTTTTGNGMLYFNITYKIVNTTATMV